MVKPGERVLKSVEVWTNDPERRMVILALQGEVASKEEARSGDDRVAEVVFKETTFDFGTVDEGTEVRHRFFFTNRGDAPLKIEEIVSS